MSDIVYLTEESFPSAIATGTVLVDFSAEWCGPCKMLSPILEALATAVQGRATVAKIDVDEAQKIAGNYDITSVPTLILFVDGVEKKRVVGLQNLTSLKNLLG
jgi:thioredoxin 1